METLEFEKKKDDGWKKPFVIFSFILFAIFIIYYIDWTINSHYCECIGSNNGGVIQYGGYTTENCTILCNNLGTMEYNESKVLWNQTS